MASGQISIAESISIEILYMKLIYYMLPLALAREALVNVGPTYTNASTVGLLSLA